MMGVIMTILDSQIPCYLISDMHEWINKIPIILIYECA